VEFGPIRLIVTDDLQRSRLTVFFRLLLALPHLFWLYLWGIAAFVAAIINWFATLIMGRSPNWLHRFLSAYLRYTTHVFAFIFLIANPFPGFTGDPLSEYPVDLETGTSESQHRLKTLFRPFLAIPALLISYILSYLLYVVAFLGWFAALVTGRMPLGLRNAGAYSIRFHAQLMAYALFVITDSYPHSGPAEFAVAAAPVEPAPALAE
jgi:hypothetical protein